MHGRRIVGLGLTWLTALSVSAAGPDEDYVRIYRTIMEADAMKENGQPKEAAKLYDNAKEALHQLQVTHPAWNERLVVFRINYIAGQLKLVRSTDALPAPTAPPPATPAPISAPRLQDSNAAVDAQLRQLIEENQGLRTSTRRLEARLREALSTQPAAPDIREVERMQNQMRDLAKENDLLKVSITHQPPPPPQFITNTVVQLQTVTNTVVANVTNTLFSRLTNTVVNFVTNGPAMDMRELAALRSGLTNQITLVTALKMENEVLKKEIAQAKTALPLQPTPTPTPVPAVDPELEKQLKAAIQELKNTQAANQQLVQKQTGLEKLLTDAQSSLVTQQAKLKRFDEIELALEKSQKDNQRLGEQKKALEQKPAQPATPSPTAAFDAETSRRLVRLERDLIESQSEIRLLTRQKADLEQRLTETRAALVQQASGGNGPATQITPGAGGAAASTEVHRQLKQAAWEVLNLQAKNSELTQKQTDMAQQLAKATSSKGTFDSIDADRLRRLEDMNKELSETKQAAMRLEQENQEMGRQLTAARESNSKNPKDDSMRKQLADAQSLLKQSENTNKELNKRSNELEKQITELRSLATNPSSEPVDPAKAERLRKDLALARETARQLQDENRSLEKKLSLADQTPKGSTKGGSKVTERELALLRTRLETLEAKAVPYTEQELALFSRLEVNIATAPTETPANSAPKAGGQEPTPISPEAILEARRDFESGNFAEAEKKFEKLVSTDGRSLFALAHLAASQFEQQKLDAAEKTTQRALAINGEDPPSLYMLGIIRLRQDKIDEAMDALSRSAKANPQNAVTQNSLGVALSQKGLRESAETAFRKALQIRPDFPDAHYNLAVEYILQQPPSHKLAQWHYQKSTAAGHPRNSELEKRLEAATAAATPAGPK